MDPFGTIANALSGQPQKTQPKAQPTAGNGGANPGGSWDAARQARDAEMRRLGTDPDVVYGRATPGTSSGVDHAMQQHADKAHPIGPAPKLRGVP